MIFFPLRQPVIYCIYMRDRFSFFYLPWRTVILTAILALGASWSGAQASSVAPQRLQAKLSPGESVTRQIKITNEEAQDATYTLAVESITLDTGGNITKTDILSPALSWVQLASAEITVPAQQTLEQGVTISVPNDATSGSYALAINVTPTTDPNSKPFQTLLLFSVTGDLHANAQVTLFSSPQGVYAPDEQIPFEVEIQNTGNTNLIPQVYIDLYRGEDWIGNIPLNDTKGVILAGGSRHFSVTWDSTLGFGKYSAEIHLTDDGLSVSSDEAISFWVMSWERIFPVFLTILTIVIIATVLLRHPSKETPARD